MSLLHSGSTAVSGEVLAEGVDFDGTYDYLSRSTDLVGNVDSKTFTFSAWVYISRNTDLGNMEYIFNTTNSAFRIYLESGTNIKLIARNIANTVVLNCTCNYVTSTGTWAHILISIDMANTSNRKIYVNDVEQVSSTWSTYTNTAINFTETSFFIGADSAASKMKGRLSNIFLDYTYRDLSIEANRRLFITADGKPADGQNYLLNEVAPFMLPDGTSGTYFDGVDDYLSRSSDLVGNVDSKTFTCSFWVWKTAGASCYIYGSADSEFIVRVNSTSIQIIGNQATDLYALYTYTTPMEFTHIMFSVDMSNTANRWVYINGIDKTSAFTWTSYNNTNINFTNNEHNIGVRSSTLRENYLKGRLAHLFLDYTYRDLSIEANRRLFITSDGKPALNQSSLNPILYLPLVNDFTNYGTGGAFVVNSSPMQGQVESYHSPILYLPMKDAATAHINEGTGGNFTANGTFATSNRGANQDNCVASYFDGTADYLSRTSLTGVADSKTFTFSCTFTNIDETSSLIFSQSSSDAVRAYIYYDPSIDAIQITMRNVSGTTILSASSPSLLKDRQTHTFSVSVDMANTSNRKMVIDGAIVSATWTTYTNDTIYFSSNQNAIGARSTVTPVLFHKGNIGELYFETVYRDLSVYNPFWIED